jgi:hypothetical protein
VVLQSGVFAGTILAHIRKNIRKPYQRLINQDGLAANDNETEALRDSCLKATIWNSFALPFQCSTLAVLIFVMYKYHISP